MTRANCTSLKIYGVFVLCLLLVTGQPGSAAAQGAPASLPLLFDSRERIAKPDLSSLARLRFLTTVDFPPFNFIDQSGKLGGFHVDLAREICRQLDIEAKCQIQAVPFETLQPALSDGQGEAIIAGIAVTPELRERFGFSRPFMRLPARFAGRREILAKDQSVAAVKGPVGVVAGTTHEAMMKAFFPTLTVKAFADRDAMLSAVRGGDVDTVFSDGLQLSFWVLGKDSAGCCRLLDGAYFSQRFLGEGLTIMNRKEDAALTQAINHALLDLSRSGRLNEIYLRYFPAGLY